MNLVRRLGVIAAVATMAATGGYFFVYLYRWEWNRALTSAAIFLAAEVGVVAWLLADRVRRLADEVRRGSPDAERRRLEVLRATAPPPRTSFAWMSQPGSTNVFIPVLLGAGAVLSGLAWVVERVARATAGRAAEHGLARRLGALDLPTDGFLHGSADPLAILRGPGR